MSLILKLKDLFSSSNNFFRSDLKILSENRKRVDLYLQLKNYDLSDRMIYLRAYDYFSANPDDFDGATMTEDLPDIDDLELAAMLHDYLYIFYQSSSSFRYTWLADKLIRSEMRRMNKSSWNTGARFVLLILKTPFFVPYTRLILGRKMSVLNKYTFNVIYRTLSKKEAGPWYQEFKGELLCSFVMIAVILGLIWRIDLFKYFFLF